MRRKRESRCSKVKACKGLTSFMEPRHSDGGGLKYVVLTDLRTLEENTMYIVRRTARDRGVALNFCPFCGASINERWTRPKPRTRARRTP